MFGLLLILLDKYADNIDLENGIIAKKFNQRFKFSHIKEFTTPYWIFIAIWIFSNWALLFNIVSNDFLSVRYGFGQIEAGYLLSKVYFIWIFIGPIFGYISDKIGYRVTFSLISTTTVAVWCFMFILIPSSSSTNKSYYGLLPLFFMKVSSSI